MQCEASIEICDYKAIVHVIDWCPWAVRGNRLMCSRDIYCSDGMKCRPQTMQPVPDVDLCKWQGRLPMQAHSYAKSDLSRLQRYAHTYCRLTFYICVCLSIFSSRRRPYEDRAASRPASSSPLRQSPRQATRMVSSSLFFRISNRTSGLPRHVCVTIQQLDL